MDLLAPIIGKNDCKPVLQMVAGPPCGGLLLGKRLLLEPGKNNGTSFPMPLVSPCWRSHCVCNFRCWGTNVCNSSGRPAGPPPPSPLTFPSRQQQAGVLGQEPAGRGGYKYSSWPTASPWSTAEGQGWGSTCISSGTSAWPGLQALNL